MKFKEWLNETMTSTSSIAGFSRMTIPLTRRKWPNVKDDKKKIKMQPQVKENFQTTTNPMDVIANELKFSFARSGGSGGQNINKVNTKAVLHWDVYQSKLWNVLGEEAFGRFIQKNRNRISKDNMLVLTSTRTRKQLQNKNDVLSKLQMMIQDATIEPVKRLTKKVSKGSKNRRMDAKTRHGDKKQQRRSNNIF